MSTRFDDRHVLLFPIEPGVDTRTQVFIDYWSMREMISLLWTLGGSAADFVCIKPYAFTSEPSDSACLPMVRDSSPCQLVPARLLTHVVIALCLKVQETGSPQTTSAFTHHIHTSKQTFRTLRLLRTLNSELWPTSDSARASAPCSCESCSSAALPLVLVSSHISWL